MTDRDDLIAAHADAQLALSDHDGPWIVLVETIDDAGNRAPLVAIGPLPDQPTALLESEEMRTTMSLDNMVSDIEVPFVITLVPLEAP